MLNVSDCDVQVMSTLQFDQRTERLGGLGSQQRRSDFVFGARQHVVFLVDQHFDPQRRNEGDVGILRLPPANRREDKLQRLAPQSGASSWFEKDTHFKRSDVRRNPAPMQLGVFNIAQPMQHILNKLIPYVVEFIGATRDLRKAERFAADDVPFQSLRDDGTFALTCGMSRS